MWLKLCGLSSHWLDWRTWNSLESSKSQGIFPQVWDQQRWKHVCVCSHRLLICCTTFLQRVWTLLKMSLSSHISLYSRWLIWFRMYIDISITLPLFFSESSMSRGNTPTAHTLHTPSVFPAWSQISLVTRTTRETGFRPAPAPVLGHALPADKDPLPAAGGGVLKHNNSYCTWVCCWSALQTGLHEILCVSVWTIFQTLPGLSIISHPWFTLLQFTSRPSAHVTLISLPAAV